MNASVRVRVELFGLGLEWRVDSVSAGWRVKVMVRGRERLGLRMKVRVQS